MMLGDFILYFNWQISDLTVAEHSKLPHKSLCLSWPEDSGGSNLFYYIISLFL